MGGSDRDTVKSRVVGTLDVPYQDPATSRRSHPRVAAIQLYDEPSVAGRMELLDVAWLRLARITAARHKVLHEPWVASTAAATLVLQISGKSIIRQQGRAAQLAPGQWCLSDSTLPYTLVSPAASRRIVLLIPLDRLEAGSGIEGLSGRSFSGMVGAGRLVFGICSWLVEEFAAIHAERTDMLAAAVTQIVNLAIEEEAANPADEPPDDTPEGSVRAYVAEHLRDPHLSPASISEHLKISKRSLHRAMRGANKSVHELIWHERLDRCRLDLLDPAQSRRSIGEIAYSWGFKNVTHFSQAFRARFGISARSARSSVQAPKSPR